MNAQDIRVAGGVHLDLLLGLAQVLRGVDDDGDRINDTPYRNRGLRMLGYSGNGAQENVESKVNGLDGVTKSRAISNDDTSAVTILGVSIAANSLHVVAFGSITAQDLVDAIYLGKAPGLPTDGSIKRHIHERRGIDHYGQLHAGDRDSLHLAGYRDGYIGIPKQRADACESVHTRLLRGADNGRYANGHRHSVGCLCRSADRQHRANGDHADQNGRRRDRNAHA